MTMVWGLPSIRAPTSTPPHDVYLNLYLLKKDTQFLESSKFIIEELRKAAKRLDLSGAEHRRNSPWRRAAKIAWRRTRVWHVRQAWPFNSVYMACPVEAARGGVYDDDTMVTLLRHISTNLP